MFCMSELPKRTTYMFGPMEVCINYCPLMVQKYRNMPE